MPSEELDPAWFRVADLPLGEMWDDARLWLPRALSGEFVAAECSYAADNSTVDTWTEAGIPTGGAELSRS